MLIRSILTIAVLGSFVFGAAAQAETRTASVQTETVTSLSGTDLGSGRFASDGGLGGTR